MDSANQSITIALAGPADLASLQHIAKQIIDANFVGMDDAGIEWFTGSGASDRFVEENIGNTYTLSANSKVAGFAICYGSYIEMLMIEPQYQGRGYGSALLAYCEQLLGQQSKQLYLEGIEGDEHALRFYRGHGWQVTGVKPDDNFDFNRVVLSKNLADDKVK